MMYFLKKTKIVCLKNYCFSFNQRSSQRNMPTLIYNNLPSMTVLDLLMVFVQIHPKNETLTEKNTNINQNFTLVCCFREGLFN